MRWLLSSAAAALVAACASNSAVRPRVEPPAGPPDAAGASEPGRGLDARIDLGGLALHLHCEGEGSPTVVFDSGLGRDGSGWFATEQAVGRATAKVTRACAYDRAGRGQSDPPVARPHSNRQMARELFALLEKADVRGPYVLVGHSLGGTNARLLLDEHPDSVAGLVLVDASPEPPPLERLPAEQRADFERGIARFEGLDVPTLLAGFDELAASKASLGDKPLVVLVAGRITDEALAEGVPEDARAAADAELAARQAAQQRLTALSTNGVLIIAEHAGHDIPNDAPELVARAVAAVVAAVRDGSRLEPSALR
jgi:pimeloyl-ACP methyl ester carboxylesterase